MISGAVNSRLEAVLALEVQDAEGKHHEFRAIVDTGFAAFLTLPISAIRSFELKSIGRQSGVLADGSEVLFDVFVGDVIWDGKKRRIDFHAAEADPLLGMAMLAEHKLAIDVKRGGKVEIASLE